MAVPNAVHKVWITHRQAALLVDAILREEPTLSRAEVWVIVRATAVVLPQYEITIYPDTLYLCELMAR